MKAVKWTAIVVGGFFALVIVALLVIPMFVDIQKYKPRIEQMVTDSTGRPFRLAGDLSLSLFPWAGVSLADLHLGNPAGFEATDFVSVKSFEVRVRLLPLIFKKVEVQKFILDSPRIELIKRKDGKWNWEGLGKPAAPQAEKPKAPEAEKSVQMPIESLAVGKFLVRNGSVFLIDQSTGSKKEIRDFRLELRDVSLDKPIGVALSAVLDGKPVSLEGTVGPVGKEPRKGPVAVKIQVKALKEMGMEITGTIRDAGSAPAFDLDLVVSPFSPRRLMIALEQPFPVATTDPGALSSVALKSKIKGNAKDVKLTDGAVNLDDSKISFSLEARDFDKPELVFDVNLDKINVDRYLPPSEEEKRGETKKGPSEPPEKKMDYTPLRRMVLDGKVRIGNLQVKGAKIQNLEMKIAARNGLFQLDPLAMDMYQGNVAGKGAFDLRSDTPRSGVTIQAKGIRVNPLLNDLVQKDFLEGVLVSDLAIRMEGDTPEEIKKTLNGKGELVFTDGAVKGVNLTFLAQSVTSPGALAERGKVEERTDFSELRVPFTLTNGVMQTPGTTMVTPLMRMEATGNADLSRETLNFRIVPKLVATLKGKGDTQKRTGILVPVMVTGTFASPNFSPDLKGIAEDQLEKKAEDLLRGRGGGKALPSKEKNLDILKSLPFGK